MEGAVSRSRPLIRSARGALVAASAAVAMVMACLPAQASTGSPATATAGADTAAHGWRIFDSPAPAGTDLALYSVTATSADDAWAVGSIAPVAQPLNYQLSVWRWNGESWHNVAVPAGIVQALSGAPFTAVVRASSATDVWIFDSFYLGAFWIHWDGSTWSYGQFPSAAGGATPAITAAVLFGPHDVWALGSGGGAPYIEHYNGSAWQLSTAPGTWSFYGASGASPADIWATTGGPQVVRWNGQRWSPVTLPASVADGFTPLSVLAQAPGDVWLGGSQLSGAGSGPAVAHWNGTSWTKQPLGPASAQDLTLLRIVPDGSGGLWGLASNNPGPGMTPVWSFWHRTGAHWNEVPAQPAGTVTDVTDMAHAPGTGSTWAVGLQYTSASPDEEGLILLDGPVPG
jgi:hypothetical protein